MNLKIHHAGRAGRRVRRQGRVEQGRHLHDGRCARAVGRRLSGRFHDCARSPVILPVQQAHDAVAFGLQALVDLLFNEFLALVLNAVTGERLP